MHDIQKYILSRLIAHQKCRYRDIKPKEVEGNLLMYHLRQLLKNGLVAKRGTAYALTADGLRLADQLSLKDMRPRIQPKIVTLIACQNDRGQWLLYQRSRQPFHGLIGFPYGKVHLGETVKQAAERELAEKTGVTAELTHRGEAYLSVSESGELVSQMLCHVFSGRRPTGRPRANSSIGSCFWANVPNPQDPGYFPGFQEIFGAVNEKGGGHFFREFYINR